MIRKSQPTRTLRERPNLDQLKRQARDLLDGYRAGRADAVGEVHAHARRADPTTFALHDAQLVLARVYGFDSWPKLKAYVDGVTVARLADAVRAADLAQVRAMLLARPELVHMDRSATDEHRALHYAVLAHAPDMARLLMQLGADARTGIYPHRDATSALTIARDRGYSDIVSIIEEEEQRREPAGDLPASKKIEAEEPAVSAAIARGDVEWLRARHAERRLESASVVNIFEPANGLLTLAVTHDRPEVLSLLLDLGLDPNERRRVDGLEPPEFSSGAPLWHCAAFGKVAMAEILLKRGADPNAQVYASGSPVFIAYREREAATIELLQRYGGAPNAITAGICGLSQVVRQMLAGEIDPRLNEGIFAGHTLAEQLLWGAADGGHPDIVGLALENIDWPRDDSRWYRMLWRPLPGHRGRSAIDREPFLASLRLMLARADPNLRGTFGRTLLHDLAARGVSDEQVAFATLLLDHGARLDARDELLQSTPLGWACRWGREALVKLLLERHADPIEFEAEAWATPQAWAMKSGNAAVLALLNITGPVGESAD